MNFKKGDLIWFIFKENIEKEQGEGYKLVAKLGKIEAVKDGGMFEISYDGFDGKTAILERNGNNIFDSEEKCKKAITKTYQARIYNFLKQAIDIFDRYLKE